TAINVVAGQVDTNKTADVFLFDKTAGTNTLVSHVPGSLATTGNGLSSNAVISGDGKTIVFYTLATNLGSTATAGVQVYLYDNDSSSATYQQLKLISHTPGSTATAGNGTSPVSPSSSFFFYSGTSAAPSGLALPGVSANGQYITYLSNASNLV